MIIKKINYYLGLRIKKDIKTKKSTYLSCLLTYITLYSIVNIKTNCSYICWKTLIVHNLNKKLCLILKQEEFFF